jgi:hypothetical protein
MAGRTLDRLFRAPTRFGGDIPLTVGVKVHLHESLCIQAVPYVQHMHHQLQGSSQGESAFSALEVERK